MIGTRYDMKWKPTHPAYERLIASLVGEVQPVYVVGGAVRDFLTGHSDDFSDLDVVVNCRVMPLARGVADKLGWAFYAMDPAREVARLVFTANLGRPLVCDISRMRGETIEHDVAARDFTVNAMALTLEPGVAPTLVDPFGGQPDLEAGVLRRVNLLSLSEDPVRLLRAVRLMVQVGLTIDPDTLAQVKRLADTVRLASAERARDELWKALASKKPHRAVDLMRSFGLLHHVLPEVAGTENVQQSAPHANDVYVHTLEVMECAGWLRDWLLGGPAESGLLPPGVADALGEYRFALCRHFSEDVASGHTRAEWLVWHAMFHDVGKPSTQSDEAEDSANESDVCRKIRFLGHEVTGARLAESRLEHLRFSRHEIALCAAMVDQHMRVHHLSRSFSDGQVSRRAAYRFFRDAVVRPSGRTHGADSIMLALADVVGTYVELPEEWTGYVRLAARLLESAFPLAGSEPLPSSPLVDGRTLMHHLGIEPGPLVGAILDEIMEAQAAGEIHTEDEAVVMAQRIVAEAGA